MLDRKKMITVCDNCEATSGACEHGSPTYSVALARTQATMAVSARCTKDLLTAVVKET